MIRIERIFQILFVDGTPLPCGGKDNMHTITERRKVEEKRKKKTRRRKSRGKKKKRKKGTKRTENAFYERSIFLAPQKRHSSGRFPSFFFFDCRTQEDLRMQIADRAIRDDKVSSSLVFSRWSYGPQSAAGGDGRSVTVLC